MLAPFNTHHTSSSAIVDRFINRDNTTEQLVNQQNIAQKYIVELTADRVRYDALIKNSMSAVGGNRDLYRTIETLDATLHDMIKAGNSTRDK